MKCCDTEHSDDERRAAVQASLDDKHRPKGKKRGDYFGGPRVHEMFQGHAIVRKGSGMLDSAEHHTKHKVTFSHAKSGALKATLGEGQAVRKKWEPVGGKAPTLTDDDAGDGTLKPIYPEEDD